MMSIHPLLFVVLLIFAMVGLGYLVTLVVGAFRRYHTLPLTTARRVRYSSQQELRAAALRTVVAGDVARAYGLQMVDVDWDSEVMTDTDGTTIIRTEIRRRDNGDHLQTVYADTDGNPYTPVSLRDRRGRG